MPSTRDSLMIVEDDPGLQSQLRWCFPDYDVVFAENRPSALDALRRHRPAVVLLDLGLPPDPANASEGLRALDEILLESPDSKIIVVTGNDERANALKAVDAGAYDFYQKPVDPDVLSLIVDRAYNLYSLQEENRRLVRQPQTPLSGIVASSPQMLEACRVIEKVAPADVTVLILGESGTGKELLARSVHRLSPRAEQRFVAINCASIPENLLESELFGYEKGAFTGADRQTIGKIEHAEGGTLFLDEVGDLPLSLQAKLLRFLQERVVERLGGRKEIPVDVRVVCATNQNIEQMMSEGMFREDLYFRLSEITVTAPPLREREGDTTLLAHAFLRNYAGVYRSRVRGFTQDALKAVRQYEWPGNVRELENKVKRAVIMADGERVTASDLQLDGIDSETARPFALREVRARAERQAVLDALGLSDGNMLRAAEILGVSRPTLYSLMNKLGLKYPTG